jgi:muramoyltetrapeptide carboxypeptidase LdcA involved in peptidoglycan recycling
MTQALYAQVRRVLAEFGREDLPVIANMDFGHTSPQMVLPLGCRGRDRSDSKAGCYT